MVDSFKKWPAEVEIHKVSSSVFNPGLDLYLISGIMNVNQFNTLKEKIPILSTIEISKSKLAVSSVLTHQQLVELNIIFTKLANEWRGQYYVITNLFVDACKPYINPVL